MREPRRVNTFGINRFTAPEEREAAARQEYVDTLQGILSSAEHVENFPAILMEGIEREMWWKPRRLGAGTLVPGTDDVDAFLAAPYPKGLGTTRAVVEKLIAGNEAAMLAWERAITRKPGSGDNDRPRNPETGQLKAKLPIDDNIHNGGKPRESPTGTSSASGRRRLDKAAAKGDTKAADLLRRVVNPDDPMTVHAACVVMGWRKHTLTVVDTKEAVSRAAVTKSGVLGLVQYVWQTATPAERAQIVEWINGEASLRKGKPA